jgi:UrcA family protein
MRVQVALIALAAAMAPMTANAYAAESDRETINIAVAYGDLDLSRAADARIMAQRLDKAATRACGGIPQFDPNYRFDRDWAIRSFEECHDAAMSAALAQLGAPLVANAYADASASIGAAP